VLNVQKGLVNMWNKPRTSTGSVYRRDEKYYISISYGEVTSKNPARFIPFDSNNMTITAHLEPYIITGERENEDTGEIEEYEYVGIPAFSEYEWVANSVEEFLTKRFFEMLYK
jgi:hypothetical protein